MKFCLVYSVVILLTRAEQIDCRPIENITLADIKNDLEQFYTRLDGSLRILNINEYVIPRFVKSLKTKMEDMTAIVVELGNTINGTGNDLVREKNVWIPAVSVPSHATPGTIDIGHGYLVGENPVTQTVSKSLCAFAGKELVSIETVQEDKLILSLLKSANVTGRIWTSGNNAHYAHGWRWGTGEPLFHTRWVTTYPTHDNTGMCIVLIETSQDRAWFNDVCSSSYLPLCENKKN